MADTTDTDNEAAESDAQVLWADVVDLIAEEGSQPALLAMLRSCKAADIPAHPPLRRARPRRQGAGGAGGARARGYDHLARRTRAHEGG